jgi:uncharacterized protein DUF3485
MSKFLLFLAALAVILGGGLAHGVWTERWYRSAALEAAAERLRLLPDDFPGWKGEVIELDEGSATVAGARASWVRRFTRTQTGETVTAVVLCGKPGRMSVHRPEYCYACAGYDMTAPAAACLFKAADAPPAQFWTAPFTKSEPDGPVHLRVYWSWSAGGAWQAPDSPRVAFAACPALYKLYVIQETAAAPGRPDEGPAAEFLRKALPTLNEVLSPPS